MHSGGVRAMLGTYKCQCIVCYLSKEHTPPTIIHLLRELSPCSCRRCISNFSKYLEMGSIIRERIEGARHFAEVRVNRCTDGARYETWAYQLHWL